MLSGLWSNLPSWMKFKISTLIFANFFPNPFPVNSNKYTQSTTTCCCFFRIFRHYTLHRDALERASSDDGWKWKFFSCFSAVYTFYLDLKLSEEGKKVVVVAVEGEMEEQKSLTSNYESSHCVHGEIEWKIENFFLSGKFNKNQLCHGFSQLDWMFHSLLQFIFCMQKRNIANCIISIYPLYTQARMQINWIFSFSWSVSCCCSSVAMGTPTPGRISLHSPSALAGTRYELPST